MAKHRLTDEELALVLFSRNTIEQLIDVAKKSGHAYHTNPRLFADVNRLSKRLKDALTRILRDQDMEN